MSPDQLLARRRRRVASLTHLTLDFLLLPLAAASVGIGAWLVEKPNVEFELLHIVGNAEFEPPGANERHSLTELNRFNRGKGALEAAGYCLIACGAFALTQAMLGWHGAKRGRPRALAMFALLTILSANAYLVSCILGIYYQSTIQRWSVSGWERLQDRYFVPLMLETSLNSRSAMSVAVNMVQIRGECCGVASAGDIARSQSWLAEITKLQPHYNITVPVSCCPLTSNFTDGLSESSQWGKMQDYLKNRNCIFTGEGRHNEPCWDYAFGESQIQQRCLAAILLGAIGFVIHAAAVISSMVLTVFQLKLQKSVTD